MDTGGLNREQRKRLGRHLVRLQPLSDSVFQLERLPFLKGSRSDVPGVVQHTKYRQFHVVYFIKQNVGGGRGPTAHRTTQLRPGPPHQGL